MPLPSDSDSIAVLVGPSKPVKGHGRGNLIPGGKKRHIKTTPVLGLQTEPLEKKVKGLRYRSAVLAERISEEIRSLLDSRLPKKDVARLVREFTWSYGVLFDKAAGSLDASLVKIQFPSQALESMKLGIALQVAPKPVLTTIQSVQQSVYPTASIAVTQPESSIT